MSSDGWASKCERAAWRLLELASQTDRQTAGLRAVIDKTGAKTSPRAPQGCHGHLQTDPLMIRLDERGHERAVLGDASHEVGHLTLWLVGSALQDNETAATVTGTMVWMPKPRAIEVVHGVGLIPRPLWDAYPTVQQSLATVRAALAVGGAAFVYEGGAAAAHVFNPANDGPPLPIMLAAYSAYTAAKALGGPVKDSTGVVADVYVDYRRRSVTHGIVVLVPASELEAARAEFAHETHG
jgi:hypothetical protein